MSEKKALIVDDDRLFRTMLDRAFARAGFVTAQAASRLASVAGARDFTLGAAACPIARRQHL